MRLISVDVAGFKRLYQSTSLNTDGRLIALVGQNNAGKSSVLDAITRLEDKDEIGGDTTRRVKIAADEPAVVAKFLLDDEDRSHVAHLLAGQPEMPRWLTLTKVHGGAVARRVSPAPVAILDDRRALAERLENSLPEGEAILNDDEEELAGAKFTSGVTEALRGDQERFSGSQIAELRKLAEILREVEHLAFLSVVVVLSFPTSLASGGKVIFGAAQLAALMSAGVAVVAATRVFAGKVASLVLVFVGLVGAILLQIAVFNLVGGL